jgi:hypothetical protein
MTVSVPSLLSLDLDVELELAIVGGVGRDVERSARVSKTTWVGERGPRELGRLEGDSRAGVGEIGLIGNDPPSSAQLRPRLVFWQSRLNLTRAICRIVPPWMLPAPREITMCTVYADTACSWSPSDS